MKNIGISQPWLFNSYNPSLINQQNDISSLFYDISMLTSQIYISQYKHLYIYHFTIFINQNYNTKNIALALKLLKSLLILKYNKNVIFNVKYPASIYHDHYQIASWLKFNIEENPTKIRPIFKKIMKRPQPNNNLKKSKKIILKPNKTISPNTFSQRINNLKKRTLKNKKSFNYYKNKTFKELNYMKKHKTKNNKILFKLQPYNAN